MKTMKSKSNEIDMCNGPLAGKILQFALPLILSGVLQMLFNAVDTVVVGRFSGSEALAAVGSTGSLINLITNLFIGLSVGANILVAKYIGAKNYKAVGEAVHTAILLSIISGSALILVGILLARPMLALMGSPDDVIDLATLYLRIYFVGMPATMLYNFGSGILRAKGDTRHPLYFLILAGLLNVVLNLFFVIVAGLGVAGVALATVISQCLSAGLILWCLVREEGYCRLYFNRLKIYKIQLKHIVRIGLPAGLQGMVFSLSNVLIQSSINSFGSTVIAGNTAAANIESFIYVAMNAFYQASLNFTSQNYGARKWNRIDRILLWCLGMVFVLGFTAGNVCYRFGETLLSIYTSDPEVISYGMIRFRYICSIYFLCGMMEVPVGCLRGMNYSILPTIVSLTGACLLRIIWIFTIFQAVPTLDVLYLSYPVSWIVTMAAHLVCYCLARRHLKHTPAGNL